MFSRRSYRFAATLAVLALLVVAAWLTPPDGREHGGLWRLAGRFHPVLLHFPVALILLVPVLELAGRQRPALREAAGVVLGLAVWGALAAALAGLALMRADGHEGALLLDHRIGGVCLAALVAIAWLLRPWSTVAYRLAVAGTLPLLMWTAHNGGSLTHGEDYLTAGLPAGVKKMLRIKETPAPETYAADTVFGAAVHPVIEKHCLACHGAEKQKGDYRMDTFAALLAGGKSGKTAIVPGDLMHSELVRRLALEPDDEKVMPPRKKARPPAAELALLRWWVKSGALRDLKLAAAVGAPPEVAALLAAGAASPGESGEPAYVARVGDYSGLRSEIDALQKSLGIQLVPVSRREGDGLILRTRGAEARFGDAELAQLEKIAPFVVEAELSATKITDAGLAALKPFSALERLHLENTAISGRTLADLHALEKLAYLNLCGTAVTDETVALLAGNAALRQVYLFGSQVTPAGLARLQAKFPAVQFGLLDVSAGEP